MIERFKKKTGTRTKAQHYLNHNMPLPGDKESYARGRTNEKRAQALLESLVEDGLFSRVRKASKKQDQSKGIDFIAYTYDGTRVLFQIKSSVAGKKSIAEKENSKDKIVIVVNDYRPDISVKDTIKRETSDYLKGKKIPETN